ncbi:MAG: replicative DNA helicase [Candidatus Latescibacteria bacterium 4484_7]|nr:MAG: replicative DNA helicase [Candidatus Latescibacteria bacterium 4484_7]
MADDILKTGEIEGLDRVPPQSLEAERAVLGGVLLEPEAATKAIEMLIPDVFYRKAHARIFKAMISLFSRREPIDVMTLSEELNKSGDLELVGGVAVLTDLVDSVPTASNIEHYARIVVEKYILRQLIRASTEIAGEAYRAEKDADTVLDEAEQKIFKISESRVSPGFIHIKEILKERFEEIQKVHETRQSVTGLSTGFIDLDAYTAGLHPSDLVIVAGRPSMGKTSFALNIAQHVGLVERKAVAIFSLEMSKELLVQRLLCSEAQVDAQKVRRGFTSAEDIEFLTRAAGLLSEAPIFIDDTPALSTLEMRARARRLKSEYDIALVIIDYMQLARSSERSENRQQEISSISRSMKALAKELNIPVIALSQLSRAVESRGGDRRPMLSDLRESGAIEQDADLVLFLYRPEFYEPDNEEKKGKAELIIGKQRNGPTGTIHLAFEKQYTRFRSLAPEGIEERGEVF